MPIHALVNALVNALIYAPIYAHISSYDMAAIIYYTHANNEG